MSESSERFPSLQKQPGAKGTADAEADRDAVEQLAEEFIERLRRGEQPSVTEYAREHPTLAEQIRELFPVVAAVEHLHLAKQSPARSLSADDTSLALQQLGDFRVIREIGRGGMGIVLEAEQVTLERRVAVKVLPKQSLRSAREVQRFHREAQTAARLHHTNIVPVFGVGQQDGVHYIVMQLIHGVGLDRILAELRRIVCGRWAAGGAASDSMHSSDAQRTAAALLHRELRPAPVGSSTGLSGVGVRSRGEGGTESGSVTNPVETAGHSAGQMPSPGRPSTPVASVTVPSGLLGTEYWKNVARIGVQVASALQYAHAQGTLHRDVKPANLLLDNGGVVWVADFGLAKAVEQDNVTWSGDLVGTLSYMAPERFQGNADARSDIYSLGLTLYELATLERAYAGKDRATLIHQVSNAPLIAPRKRNPSIPRDLETIILKAAARDPSDRYQTADQLVTDLQCYLEDRPILARRTAPVERFSRWCRRNKAVASLTGLVIVLMLLVSAVVTVGYVREASQRQRAEATAQLAMDVLDNIYSQFAPSSLRLSQPAPSDDTGDALLLSSGTTHLPLSADVALLLENLLHYYDHLSRETDDNQRALLQFISANRRVGDIHHRLGELDRAQAAYKRAAEVLERSDRPLRDQQAARLELSRIYNGLGMVYADQHQQDQQAYEAHQRALELLEEDSSQNSQLAERQYEVARTLYLLHLADMRRERFRRRGRRGPERRAGEAEQSEVRAVDRAIGILEELTGQYAQVPEYKFLLARCYLASDPPWGRRNRDGNPNCSEKAIAILEDLVASYPEVPDYRYELGDAYARQDYGRLFRRSWADNSPAGLAASEQRLQKAMEATQDLELLHPNIPQYLELKSKLHRTLGLILVELNRLGAAEQHLREAVDRQRLVVARASDKHGAQLGLAFTRLDLAEIQRKLGRLDEVQSAMNTQRRELQRLLESDARPEQQRHFTGEALIRTHLTRALDKTYLTLADVLTEKGEPDQAAEWIEKARKLRGEW